MVQGDDIMSKVVIIAEAGVNHNGDIELAKKMVDVAAESGADYVKFQTASLDGIVSKSAKMSQYQIKNIGVETSQKEMLSKLLLPFEAFEELYKYCITKNIAFLSTPFDIESIDFLNDLGVPFWKIPSGEVTNYPYLKHIGQTKKPVVMSCGMSTLEEIEAAIRVLRENGTTDISILHCNTDYPTNMSDVNLRAMNWLQERLGVQVGYSDHTLGTEVAIAAVAMGAHIIEKHFTLDRSMEGPDHVCSLEPSELKQMVQAIRNIEQALGEKEKKVTDSEKHNIEVARKSIVCVRNIKRGEMITEDMLTTKRPGNGISPMEWKSVIGKHANRDYKEDDMLDNCILKENIEK